MPWSSCASLQGIRKASRNTYSQIEGRFPWQKSRVFQNVQCHDRNNVAVYIVVVFDVESTFASFEQRSLIEMKNLFTSFLCGSRLSICKQKVGWILTLEIDAIVVCDSAFHDFAHMLHIFMPSDGLHFKFRARTIPLASSRTCVAYLGVRQLMNNDLIGERSLLAIPVLFSVNCRQFFDVRTRSLLRLTCNSNPFVPTFVVALRQGASSVCSTANSFMVSTPPLVVWRSVGCRLLTVGCTVIAIVYLLLMGSSSAFP